MPRARCRFTRLSVLVLIFQLVAASVCLAYAGQVTAGAAHIISGTPSNAFEATIVGALNEARLVCCAVPKSNGCAWLQGAIVNTQTCANAAAFRSVRRAREVLMCAVLM
jgi:hypothetical protein